jgi:hypothetical protein
VGHPGAELAEAASFSLISSCWRAWVSMWMWCSSSAVFCSRLWALGHLLLQLVGAAGQLLLVRRLLVQHGVELATELGQLVIGVEGQHADAGRLTRLHLAHHLVHPLDGVNKSRAPR